MMIQKSLFETFLFPSAGLRKKKVDKLSKKVYSDQEVTLGEYAVSPSATNVERMQWDFLYQIFPKLAEIM